MLRAYQLLLAAPTKRWIAGLALVGALPVVLSALDGTFRNVPVLATSQIGGRCPVPAGGIEFRGLESAVNWWIYIVFLPVAFVLLKSVVRHTIGDAGNEPPIAMLVSERGRPAVAEGIRARLASPRVPLVVLAIIMVIAAYDALDVVRTYVAPHCPFEKDWTVYFLIQGHGTSRALNAIHVIVAYLIQYGLGFAALLIFGLVLEHNVSYINRVYQRRRGADPTRFIVLAFDDPDCYFGQAPLVPGFRLQVLYVVLAGIAVSFSRYANVDTATMTHVWETLETEIAKRDGVAKVIGLYNGITSLDWSGLFPDPGQWTLAVLFAIVFVIVGIPSFVKFLPFLKSNIWMQGPSAYLAEFVPADTGTEPTKMKREELKRLAAEFAANSFWPAGDPVAQRLFFFVYTVMIFIIFPIPVRPWRLIGLYVICVVAMALTLTVVAFTAYRGALAIVSDDLAKKPER